jgi:hypothetical protein
MSAPLDSLTVLRSVHNKHAAKQFTFVKGKRGEPDRIANKSYGKESHFRVERVSVGGFAELNAALDRLAADPFAFLIRDEPLPHTNLNHTRRWARPHGNEPATFAPMLRRWLPVDLDHIAAPPLTDVVTDPDAAIEHLIGLLPRELHDVKCRWQFTSSQGLPGSEGLLSARLYYWLGEAYDNDALKRWTAAANAAAGFKLIDPVLYHPIQAIYTAAPLFRNMADPLPRRCGVRDGLEDEAVLIIPPPDAKRPEEIGSGYEPGPGVASRLAEIGGAKGFRAPIVSAIASYIATYGAAADCASLKQSIREAIDRAAPGGRSADQLERYKSDAHLDDIIAAIRTFQGDRPGTQESGEPPPDFDEQTPPPPEDEAPDPPVIRPVIRVVGGELPNIIDAAEAILIARDSAVFAFGDQVVRPAIRPIRIADNKETTGLRLVPIAAAHMAERFTRHIDFQKYNKKERKSVSIDCPHAVAATFLERIGLWRLRQLTALTTCPLLLPDGNILERPGFHEPSGILYDSQGVRFPPVPREPTKDEARAALARLMAPFREFPFVDDKSRSVLSSALLSGPARYAVPFVPCHAFDATAAGTGKSKLANCVAILMTGRECAAVTQGADEAEFEKKLGAILLAGDPLVSIDNCTWPLDSPILCVVVSEPTVQIRILGFSKTAVLRAGLLVLANGNNFSFEGDMLRRGLKGRLDAGVERPELREFKTEDPVRVLKRQRARFVIDALTVLRAYIVAGHPAAVPPLGGFEDYSALICGALVWLDEANPVDTIEEARAADPQRQALEAVLTQWRLVFGNRSLTTHAVIEEACGSTLDPTAHSPNHIGYWHPDLRNALLDVANDRGRVSAERLGQWLRGDKGKAIGHFRLAADTPRDGNRRWRLEERQADGKWR